MKGLRPLHASQELKRDFFDNLTFSRLGEGFYSCAVFMLLGRSIQQSQTDTNDQCTQPRPRGTLIADQRRACAARPWGKAGNERRKACFHPGGSGFHLPCGVARATPCFHPIDFYVTNRFFVTFFTEESNVPLVPSFSLVSRHTMVSLATTRG